MTIKFEIKQMLILLISVLANSYLLAQEAQSVNPHGKLSIDINCSSCHNAEAWSPAKQNMDFDHDSQTNFALIGKHGITDCESCHLELDFTEPSIFGEGCETCHVDVHQGTFSQTCTDCHNQENFTDVDGMFIHTMTNFPLTGAHQQIECQTCHVDQSQGHFTNLDFECIDCHEQDYEAAETVNHVDGAYPLTCEDCHTTLAWQPAFFDHVTASQGFRLLGSHELVDCASCHIFPSNDLIFNPSIDEDCYACHAEDYEDEHGGTGFPTDCLACHNVNNWDGTDFEHTDISNGFELLGAHRKTDCNGCHTPDFGLVFTPPPVDQNDCFSCHADDYADEHAGSGFPTDCQTCHNVNDWEDATFEHSSASGGFELLGAHNQSDCSSCHASDLSLVFNPPPADQNDCYTCHVEDYEAEHAGTGFPTDCQSCHNVDNWEEATFDDHDKLYFPIFSGEHRGEWNNDCQSCHIVPTDFSQFECITCHEHRESEVNDEHDEVSGYIYLSTACFSCHPDGKGDD